MNDEIFNIGISIQDIINFITYKGWKRHDHITTDQYEEMNKKTSLISMLLEQKHYIIDRFLTCHI